MTTPMRGREPEPVGTGPDDPVLDVRAYDRAMAELERGEDEVVPEAVAQRLLAGEDHPLRVWREHRGLTQEALATSAGVGKSYISQLEAGRKSGSLDAMRRLASALEVDIEDLLLRMDGDAHT